MISEFSKWVILIIIVIIVIFIIKAGVKIINILITALILGFAWFSFFTDSGAARLSILLKGNIIEAYTTNLTKDEKLSNDKVVYFKSSKPIKDKYAKCNKMWIVRIPVVE